MLMTCCNSFRFGYHKLCGVTIGYRDFVIFQLIHGRLGLLFCLHSHKICNATKTYEQESTADETVHGTSDNNPEGSGHWKLVSLLMDRIVFVIYVVVNIFLFIFYVVRP